MIEYKQIRMQNFLSIGQQPIEIDLNTGESTLIIGKNNDVGAEGYSRNGVGKSTIFQAISYVLYDEGLSPIKKDAFVNVKNGKKMLVELDLVVDGIDYTIKRGRKPSVLEILRNGKPYTQHSAGTVDDAIEELIGKNFDTFVNTDLLNTNTITFMNMKPAAQRNFMEDMVGINTLTERANLLKIKRKDLDTEIKLENQKIELKQKEREQAEKRLESVKKDIERWDHNQEVKIQNNLSALEELEKIDVEDIKKRNEEYDKSVVEQEDLNKELSVVKESELSELTETKTKYHEQCGLINQQVDASISEIRADFSDKTAEITNERASIKDDINDLKNAIRDTEQTIKSNTTIYERLEGKNEKLTEEITTLEDGTCPYCGQEHFDKDKVKELKASIKSNMKEMDELRDTNIELKEALDEATKDLSKLTDKLTEVTDNIDLIQKQLDEMIAETEEDRKKRLANTKKVFEKDSSKLEDKYKLKKEELEEAIDKISVKKPNISLEECYEVVSSIKTTKEAIEKDKKEENPYKKNLKAAEEDIVDYDDTKLKELAKRDMHYQLLIKMLTDSKSYIRKNLLDNYIPYINTRLEYYLEKLDLPHIVEFNNDLTVDIFYMGKNVSYGNLSNGEKGRLNFSVSMAFRDLMSVTGHKSSFLGIDELLDNGIDTSGFKAIFRILNEREGESLFIISHRDDLVTSVDKTITVEKNNGFTRIVG